MGDFTQQHRFLRRDQNYDNLLKYAAGFCMKLVECTGENTKQPVVLVAEDNVVNRLVITSFLEKIECVVLFAENGQKAIDQFEAADVDLILMDINMPIKDGISATKTIRNLERKSKAPHTPIVAVTAHDDEDHRRRCNSAGMDGFIAKPLNGNNLLTIVSLWLFGSVNAVTQYA